MREMHLTPNLWVVSAKKIFLPKIAIWKEEIQYWKLEMAQLQRLTVFGAIRCTKREKELLLTIEQELTTFIQEQIPLLERAIHPLERILEGKALGCKFRQVEEQIERMRKTYYDLKMQLLPFLAKFISVQIW